MPEPHIAQNCPLTPAERGVVAAWAAGNITDKEAAKALNKGHRTVRTQRESIANRAGAAEFKTGAGHLLIRLIELNWLRFLLLGALTLGPVFEITHHIDISNERARRSRRRREYLVVGRVTAIKEL